MTTLPASFVTPAAAIYLVNLAAAALLISLTGLVAAELFRSRHAPLRHAILVSALMLTLLAPALTWLACQSGWGRIPISLAEPVAKRLPPAADVAPAKDPELKTAPDNLPPDAALPVLPFVLNTRQKAAREDAPALPPALAAPQPSTSLPKESPARPATATSWRLLAIALAAAAWLLGTLIGAGFVVRGFVVLRRFRRSLEMPSLVPLEQAAREAADVFGLERLPPIQVSARTPAPLSLGLLHPLIVLPKGLAEQCDVEQLRAILIHETAHIVHRHQWIGLAQWLAGILFWWNPLLHRVNRGILQLCEEICDDHVLQSRSDGREFARLLVDLAARLADLPRVPTTLAILETGYSDFQHRITNLLDKERIIVTHITRKAMFCLALFVLAISLAVPFAGLRAEQNHDGNKAAETIESSKSKTAITAAEHSTENRAGEKAPAAKRREIAGRILDLTGKPIAGAKVGLQVWPIIENGLPNSPFVAVAEADASGKYRLTVPQGINIADTYMAGTVWAIADGYQPKRQNGFGPLSYLIVTGETLKLAPSRGTVVRIIDAKGGPVPGVRVTIRAQRPKEDFAFPVPPDWYDRLSDMTGADGRARISNAIPDAITEATLQPRASSASVRLNQDYFLNRRPGASAPHFTWSPPETGTIEGRLDVRGGKLPANLKIEIQTESRLANEKYPRGIGTWGETAAVVGPEGRFHVNGIAAGPIVVLPFLDDKQPLRANIPERVVVQAGKTTRLEIPVRRGVLVRGLIRKQDTKAGYPGFYLDLVYGQSAKIQRDAHSLYKLTTDKDGRFSAIVPPGPIELTLRSLPSDYLSVQYWEDNDRFIVPDGRESFDLEPIELVRAVSISGKLVDLDNKPLSGVDWIVYGTPEIPGKNLQEVTCSFGGIFTGKDGRFSGSYPRTYPPVHWRVSHRRWPTPYQFVDDKWDAKILSRKPFVLQVPVHAKEMAKQADAEAKTGPSPDHAGAADHKIHVSKDGPGASGEGKGEIDVVETVPLGSDSERLNQFFATRWRLESVEKELDLTDQQKKQLDALDRQPSEPYFSGTKERAAQVQRSYRRLQAILLPKQLDRAEEIAIQLAGPSAFFDADVVKALQITGDQRTKMHSMYRESTMAAMAAIRKEYPAAFADPRALSEKQQRALQEEGNALEKLILEKYLKLLSTDQRTRYEKMIGKKIDRYKLTNEILDASFAGRAAPAYGTHSKQEDQADKEAAQTPAKITAPPAVAYSSGYQSSPASAETVAAMKAWEAEAARKAAAAAAAMKVLRARPPTAEKDRIAAALVVLRSCDMGEEEDGYPLEHAIRELILIGKPAVPRLVEELDRTQSDHLLRDLGFVLRGIDDPRAVPALIRAIPRIAQPTFSDCGYTINNDPELMKFMHENDSRKVFPLDDDGVKAYAEEATMFSYGRPINEIMPALQKITGQRHRWFELVFSQIGNSAEQNRLKRLEFQKLAARWADWWEKNWRKFVKDEGEAQIELTQRTLARNAADLAKVAPQPLMEVPFGKDIDVGDRETFPYIVSFDDPRILFRFQACIDLDTGRLPLPPQELLKTSSPGSPSRELLSWAEKEGVHLIGMKFRPHGSQKSYFAFQPVGMKVWRIDNHRYENLEKELQEAEKLDLPGLWEGPIASLDEKTGQIDDHHPASFLFLTRRGTCGTIRLQSKETYPIRKIGTPPSETSSPFELQFIYRSDKGH